ncbi:hypothetical protein CKA38_03875 [Ereboglobus luteus]|uniref:Phosphatidic acid phosphatase type 2/haloperoxidase domain-containing protein n=1 Tax=Ereboglobus luteus TaxID=1796921 RepID=A0A2U8E1V1_9BACT|nr:hypothetical protein CKA38_03875 [Ereboglobus luteus]
MPPRPPIVSGVSQPSNSSRARDGVANRSAGLSRIVLATAIATVVLLAPALAAWIAGWQWTPENKSWVPAAVLLTDTAGFPFAIATCGALAALFVLLIKPSWPRGALMVVLLCAAAVCGGQIVKTVLKNSFQEPRPYVEWLAQNHGLKSEQFYAMMRGGRAEWLRENIAADPRVPEALRKHWEAKTGYSFPSGHTAFVAVWALLGVTLLWRRGWGGRVCCCALVAWALLVESTRLALGMHWPGDVAAGVLLSWVVVAGLAAVCRNRMTPPAGRAGS